jgi:hypothetical protein
MVLVAGFANLERDRCALEVWKSAVFLGENFPHRDECPARAGFNPQLHRPHTDTPASSY